MIGSPPATFGQLHSLSICGMIGSPPATFGQLHSLPSHSNVELTTVALLALSASPHSMTDEFLYGSLQHCQVLRPIMLRAWFQVKGVLTRPGMTEFTRSFIFMVSPFSKVT